MTMEAETFDTECYDLETVSTVLPTIRSQTIDIIYIKLPVVVFDVHLLAGRRTTAGDSSLTLAVVCA